MPLARDAELSPYCWECDQFITTLRVVTLCVGGSTIGPVVLCHPCYLDYYLPMVMDLMLEPEMSVGVMVA